jgi:hypothetical protein
MPRRPKPPGYEKWTWAEINAGRKMSRGERSAAHRWQEISKAGPGFHAFAAVLVILFALLCWVLGGMKP